MITSPIMAFAGTSSPRLKLPGRQRRRVPGAGAWGEGPASAEPCSPTRAHRPHLNLQTSHQTRIFPKRGYWEGDLFCLLPQVKWGLSGPNSHVRPSVDNLELCPQKEAPGPYKVGARWGPLNAGSGSREVTHPSHSLRATMRHLSIHSATQETPSQRCRRAGVLGTLGSSRDHREAEGPLHLDPSRTHSSRVPVCAIGLCHLKGFRMKGVWDTFPM